MKTLFLSFLLFFGLFEMAHAADDSSDTIIGSVKGACERALGKVMGFVDPQDELQSDLVNKFAQYGHQVDEIKNADGVGDNVHRKGLANLALALERETPVTRHSKMITGIVITTNGSRVAIGDNVSGGLNIFISAYTPVEEIVPKMNLALLKHEIARKAHVHNGPTSFRFDKGVGVDDEKLASFLEIFINALEYDKGVARIADFPEYLRLNITNSENIISADSKSAVYNGLDILVSADAPVESLFHHLANAFLERQVTDWMRRHYIYIARHTGSAVINNGVDDTAYEKGLKLLLKWFDDSSLVRESEDVLTNLNRIYVTENQLEIRPRSLSDSETVFDIYIPSNGSDEEIKTFLLLSKELL